MVFIAIKTFASGSRFEIRLVHVYGLECSKELSFLSDAKAAVVDGLSNGLWNDENIFSQFSCVFLWYISNLSHPVLGYVSFLAVSNKLLDRIFLPVVIGVILVKYRRDLRVGAAISSISFWDFRGRFGFLTPLSKSDSADQYEIVDFLDVHSQRVNLYHDEAIGTVHLWIQLSGRIFCSQLGFYLLMFELLVHISPVSNREYWSMTHVLVKVSFIELPFCFCG